ncbi:MAG: VWA domain-containing protein [Vampirovibrionales bacterium]|nr:VWA domain-containing protein [Vampirovibrionales bacterium]
MALDSFLGLWPVQQLLEAFKSFKLSKPVKQVPLLIGIALVWVGFGLQLPGAMRAAHAVSVGTFEPIPAPKQSLPKPVTVPKNAPATTRTTPAPKANAPKPYAAHPNSSVPQHKPDDAQGQLQQAPSQARAEQENRAVLLILDASSSMDVKTPDGETKMIAAKRAVLDIIRNLQPHRWVGLRVYGNAQSVRERFNPCRASRLVVPLGVNNRAFIASSLVGVMSIGATPISFAIRQAVSQDLAGIRGPKSIVLISDGQETCDSDPCELARQIALSGVDLKINVIGFGIQDVATQAQLKCVAASTLGSYTQADTYGQLAQQLKQASGAVVEERVEGRVFIPQVKERPQTQARPQAPAAVPVMPELTGTLASPAR